MRKAANLSRSQVRKALDLISNGHSFVVTSHVNPEGDAIGSMIAMALLLEGLGKKVVMAMQDPIPAIYGFLPAIDRVLHPPIHGTFDTAVVVDCEGISRVGTVSPVVTSAPALLSIDHHPAEAQFGDVDIRDTSAAAVGEIITELLQIWGIPITPSMAECLLTALMVDTGAFRYSNVTPRALRTAATLMEHGASITRVISYVFESKPASSVRLMGRALSAMQVEHNGGITYSTLSRDDFAAAGAADNETDGIVNHLLTVSGARASILFRESADGIRVSLRSRNGVDVNRVARMFGGGGHVRAAGCTLPPPMQNAVATVVAELARELDRVPPSQDSSAPSPSHCSRDAC